MKTIIPTDRNTFFNVRREHLQSLRHPLKRGNVIPESYKESGVYYDEKSWQPFPKVYGGAGQTQTGYSSDRNIFFQVPIRQEPFLRKRVIKDLEPGSRVVGALAITKKERDAEGMLKGINALGTLLTEFLSAPIVDPVTGEPMIDPITNRPVMQKRSLFEVLQVSHASIFKLFTDLGIPRSPTMNVLINSLSVQNSVNTLQRAEDIIKADPNRSIADTKALIKQVVLNEKLDEDEIKDPRVLRAIDAQVLEQKISTGDEKDPAIGPFIKPTDWDNMNPDEKAHLRSFIIAREASTANRVANLAGQRLNWRRHKVVLHNQFDRSNRYLNTDTLQFVSRHRVPIGDR